MGRNHVPITWVYFWGWQMSKSKQAPLYQWFEKNKQIKIEVSNRLGYSFWPIAWHAKRLGQVDMTQLLQQPRLVRPNGMTMLGLRKQLMVPTHLTVLIITFYFYFLLFPFQYMSNVYNTPLNNYIIASLRGKKINQ